jgi:hypothetical protein
MGEFGLSETLRAIIVQEQEHEIDLSAALGINVPPRYPADGKMVEPRKAHSCLKAINPATRTNRNVRREHIEAGYEKKGVSTKNAEARAWATVNKLTGGGKKSGSGRNQK